MKALNVVCGVAVMNDLVFMAKRKPGKSYAGFWEFPGGKVEFNESHSEALERELQEELNLSADIGDFICSGEDIINGKLIRLHAYYIDFIGEPTMSTDHDEMKWFSLEDLVILKTPPADEPIISRIISTIGDVQFINRIKSCDKG